MSKFAWVTLTTNDTYSLGALVLAHSLRRAGTQHQLAVLITPGVSESMRGKLKDVYNVVQEVNVLDSQDTANLALLSRPELGITFTKLHCWRLVQFEKCVFLDSDVLVLQNCDELFEREELSAAPDVSWPDCFNSGVFVYKPNQETYDKIVEFAIKNGSFDGGDQGLLNQYFSNWATSDIKKHLPFLYNVTAYATYCYLPAFKQFRDKIKILHFAGKIKPWLIHFNTQSKTPSVPSEYTHAADLIEFWWSIFFDKVHQHLDDDMLSLVGDIDKQDNVKIIESERYSLSTTVPGKSHSDNLAHHEQQEHYRQPYNLQYKYYQEHYNTAYNINNNNNGNKIEFHDPWEDYYTKQEIAGIRQQEQRQQREEQKLEENKDIMENNYKEQNAQDVVKNQKENKKEDEHKESDEFKQEVQMHVNLQQRGYEEDNYQERVVHERKERDLNKYFGYKLPETKNVYENKINANVKILTIQKSNIDLNHQYNNVNNSNTSLRINKTSCSLYNSKEKEDDDNIISASNDNNVGTQQEAGLAAVLSHLRLGEPCSPEQEAYEQLMRRQCWESGQIDYDGRDAFDNIWKKITQTLESKPDNKTGSA